MGGLHLLQVVTLQLNNEEYSVFPLPAPKIGELNFSTWFEKLAEILESLAF